MRAEFLLVLFQDGDCDIGAMVGYSFIAVERIGKDESAFERARAVLQSADVGFPAFCYQQVDHLLQGLDPKKRYRLRELNAESWRWPHSPLLGKCTDFVAEMAKGARLPTGEALARVGLPVWLGDKDYDSAVFELVAE